MYVHEPVLLEAVLELLAPRGGEACLVDATLGEGGHAAAFLGRFPELTVVGVEKDGEILRRAEARLAPFGARVRLVHASFADFFDRWEEFSGRRPERILMDLGVSMFHFEESGRGFSFRRDEPLDMRLDASRGRTAAELLQSAEEGELARILQAYGEEPRARRIAAAIVRHRERQGPITHSGELARVVAGAAAPEARRGRTHPATRTFQALRIAVNDEFECLAEALPQTLRLLAPGGRLVITSFHSLEDRLIKEFFRNQARDCLCPPEAPICTCGHRAALGIVTKKPIRPSAEEVTANPRSRSAKLRIAYRL